MVDVQFTDKLTAQLASTSAQVNVLQYRHKIIIDGPPNFLPGLPYIYKVTVKKFDGSPAPENAPFNVTTTFDNADPLNETFTLNNLGSQDVVSSVPVNATSIQISVSHMAV